MRENNRSTHTRATYPLFYSALPQIVFRNLLPDEEVIRAVQQRCGGNSSCSRALVASVTVAKDDLRGPPMAELKLLGWALPIQASGATAAAAVHGAFNQLQVQARAMLGTETIRDEADDTGNVIARTGREVSAERGSHDECSSTQ
jgi:hypothetical protein